LGKPKKIGENYDSDGKMAKMDDFEKKREKRVGEMCRENDRK